MNKMFKNRAYVGEYHHGGITVEGGMSQIVDAETFDRAQGRLAENKRNGARHKAGAQEQDALRYWLTGKLYCGECGGSMQGMSGTSKTGKKYYYACKEQRAKRCARKPVCKEVGRGCRHGHPQGAAGRQREPRLHSRRRGQIL
jgi:site-specific DNA recombinase